MARRQVHGEVFPPEGVSGDGECVAGRYLSTTPLESFRPCDLERAKAIVHCPASSTNSLDHEEECPPSALPTGVFYQGAPQRWSIRKRQASVPMTRSLPAGALGLPQEDASSSCVLLQQGHDLIAQRPISDAQELCVTSVPHGTPSSALRSSPYSASPSPGGLVLRLIDDVQDARLESTVETPTTTTTTAEEKEEEEEEPLCVAPDSPEHHDYYQATVVEHSFSPYHHDRPEATHPYLRRTRGLDRVHSSPDLKRSSSAYRDEEHEAIRRLRRRPPLHHSASDLSVRLRRVQLRERGRPLLKSDLSLTEEEEELQQYIQPAEFNYKTEFQRDTGGGSVPVDLHRTVSVASVAHLQEDVLAAPQWKFKVTFTNVSVLTALLAFFVPTTAIVLYGIFRLVFGTLFPAYYSYKAVKTKNVKEYVKWMMYWIVFAFFTCLETLTDLFLSFWFPFYYELKILVVLWLLSPATKGSSILYRKFVHPWLTRKEDDIDDYIAKAKQQSYSTVIQLGSKGVNYATNVLMQTAIKGGGGIVNQLRRSYSSGELAGGDMNRNVKALPNIQDPEYDDHNSSGSYETEPRRLRADSEGTYKARGSSTSRGSRSTKARSADVTDYYQDVPEEAVQRRKSPRTQDMARSQPTLHFQEPPAKGQPRKKGKSESRPRPKSMSPAKKLGGDTPKRARKVMTLEEKVKILNKLREGMSFAAAGRMFHVNESFVRTIKRMEKEILAAINAGDVARGAEWARMQRGGSTLSLTSEVAEFSDSGIQPGNLSSSSHSSLTSTGQHGVRPKVRTGSTRRTRITSQGRGGSSSQSRSASRSSVPKTKSFEIASDTE
ncbi:receptor expression enhancing protein A isoform X2 [Oratosquilla oratoria]|uniref:receptor expression enhancing protein A isoform X2 n=1 Tax=Oratosquilla oratoria TaxID=337810 RepID=UPI003F761EEF